MKKLNLQTFIERSNEVHKNKYLYKEANYINTRTKIKIYCPEHGEFFQKPSDHMAGRGCPGCGKSNCAKKIVEERSVKFIKKAALKHENKYNYDKVKYINSKQAVTITCPVHGDFEQRPNSHLNGCGCKKCGSKSAGEFFASSVNEFITKSAIVHNNKYDYSLVDYKNSKTKVVIICPEHGKFEQIPNNHLTGYGCQQCAKSGFDSTKKAILYYLKVVTENCKTLYKIGITNKSVKERFDLTELTKIEIVKQKEFEKGIDAYEYEQELLKKYVKYKYVGPKILKSGNTELFTKDILEFENQGVFYDRK